MSPEMCTIVLISHGPLQDLETFLIDGVRIIGRYKGYGQNLEYLGASIDDDINTHTIVAMDALEFDMKDPKPDLELPNILRELNKAYCAFRCQSGNLKTVATGDWGCGHFGGNKFVKAIIQTLAASLAGLQLIYYEISHPQHNAVGPSLQELTEKCREITISTFFDAFIKCRHNDDQIFQQILSKLSLEPK